MTDKKKIEILQRQNEELRTEIERLTALTTKEMEKEIAKYKKEEQKLLDEIRKVKDRAEKDLRDFYAEKLAYEKNMKRIFKLRKPINIFQIKK